MKSYELTGFTAHYTKETGRIAPERRSLPVVGVGGEHALVLREDGRVRRAESAFDDWRFERVAATAQTACPAQDGWFLLAEIQELSYHSAIVSLPVVAWLTEPSSESADALVLSRHVVEGKLVRASQAKESVPGLLRTLGFEQNPDERRRAEARRLCERIARQEDVMRQLEETSDTRSGDGPDPLDDIPF